MASYHRKSYGGIVFSLTLHVALVAALVVSVDMPWRNRQPPAPAPIQAEIIDAKAFEAEIKAKDEAKRAAEEAERQRELAAQRERDLEAQRQRDLEAQREKDRLARVEADRQRAIDEQKRLEAEQEKVRLAKEAEQLKQQQIAEERARAERERKEREERERKEREERERVARAEEARLREQLAEEQRRAEEAARAAAARQTARDAYVRLITNHITSRWVLQDARPGLKCVVNVRQATGGHIVNWTFGSCNGDEVVRRSIEDALNRSSPLPSPPDLSLFERNLEIIFEPIR